MTIYHKHHVIPKHMGGSNGPSNVIELTIKEHAEAHRQLFLKYGKIEDKCAWKMLSGKTIEGEQLRIQLAKIGWKKYISDPRKKKDWKEKLRKANIGKTHSKETRKKISDGNKLAAKENRKFWVRSKNFDYALHCLKNNSKLSEGRKKSIKWQTAVRSKESKSKKQKATGTNIILNGISYPSLREAAKLSGFGYNRIRNSFRKFGNVITIN